MLGHGRLRKTILSLSPVANLLPAVRCSVACFRLSSLWGATSGAALLFCIFFTVVVRVPAQQEATPAMISTVIIDTLINEDFSFTDTWDYPSWMVKDETTGQFENTLDSTITPADTAHLYHTACCTTSHQGEHVIRYCTAVLDNDTLTLHIADRDAAYHGALVLRVADSVFSGRFDCRYIMSVPGENITWTIVSQSLTLDTATWQPGQRIRGKIAVTFREDFSAPGYTPVSKLHYVEGLFATTITAAP